MPNWCNAKKLLVAHGFFLWAVLVAACGQAPERESPSQAPLMDLLVMPLGRYEAVEKIELKSVLRDTSDPTVTGRAARDLAHLARMGIAASGYFKYYLTSGGGFRLKVNVYKDESSRDADWRRRYPEDVQEGAQSFGESDAGFYLPGKAVVLREQELLIEITPFKNTPDLASVLPAFAKRYHQHARAILASPS